MPSVDLSCGSIQYTDSSGHGPVVVLLHGVAMNGGLWSKVEDHLRSEVRCIVPTLPLGSHTIPLEPDTDMSPRGVARLVLEFLRALDLGEVTLVGVDTGGALAQLIVEEDHGPVGRLALVSCDAFDNFPPGLPGRVISLTALPPGGLALSMQMMRFAPLRRLPFTWGWMSKRPVDNEMFAEWLRPLISDRLIRRDLRRFLRAVNRTMLVDAAESLRTFDKPASVIWAAEDKVMPLRHAAALTDLLPDAEYVEIEDSYTLIPIDQPAALAAAIRHLVRR